MLEWPSSVTCATPTMTALAMSGRRICSGPWCNSPGLTMVRFIAADDESHVSAGATFHHRDGTARRPFQTLPILCEVDGLPGLGRDNAGSGSPSSSPGVLVPPDPASSTRNGILHYRPSPFHKGPNLSPPVHRSGVCPCCGEVASMLARAKAINRASRHVVARLPRLSTLGNRSEMMQFMLVRTGGGVS